MTSKFMTDPIRILVKRDELTLEGNIKNSNRGHFLGIHITDPSFKF